MRLIACLLSVAVASSVEATDNTCISGFQPLTDGWCFATLERGTYTFQDAEDACYSKFEAHLPTLSTAELNDAVVRVRNNLFKANSYIWIGLNCSEDGDWYWLDGTPYDAAQENFDPGSLLVFDALRCDPTLTTTFTLTVFGYWQALAAESQVSHVFCTARSNESGQTQSPEELICPEGYTLVDDDGEKWCFVWNKPLPPESSVNFEEAKSLCEERLGETLPILRSSKMVDALDAFRSEKDAGTLWIGIVCNHETLDWEWEDGVPLGYPDSFTNFLSAPPFPCTDDKRFVQTIFQKKWMEDNTESRLISYVCARRASTISPPLPTLPPSSLCPPEMTLLHDWCYSFDLSPIGDSDYEVNSEENGETEEEHLHHYCEKRYGGFLPSVSSEQESDDLMFLRRFDIGFDAENLWMALECGDKNQWIWTNGELWSGYTKFAGGEDPVSCNYNSLDNGHLFDATGKWIDGYEQRARYVACSRRPEGYASASTVATTTTKSALVCLDGYKKYTVNGEEWCFVLNYPIAPAIGMSFEAAKKMCDYREGETLPLLKSRQMVDALGTFRESLGTNDLWIGIVCNFSTLQWEWEDGEPVDYNNFMDVQTGECAQQDHFVQSALTEKWIKMNTYALMDEYVCMRRAMESIPPLPTLPPSPYCPDNMYPLGEWCYGMTKPMTATNFQTAEYLCERDFHAFLPAMSSDKELENLIFVRRYFLGSDSADLWIGVQCGTDDKWKWSNGEPWSGYSKFKDPEDVNSCAHEGKDSSFLFDKNGLWIDGTDIKTKYIVCAVRYSEITFITTIIPTTQSEPERCPPNFLELLNGTCISKAWKEAVTFDTNIKKCNDSGATLPSISSEEENNEYVDLMNGTTGISSIWIGLLCVPNEDFDGSGSWAWQDGTPFTYSHFIDTFTFHPTYCYPDRNEAFTLEIGGGWNPQNRESAQKHGICVTPADLSVSTPVPAICDDGWQSIDGACFIFDATKKKLSRFNAQQECKKLDANLPSITSTDQNERIYYATYHMTTFANAQFWLGLQCGKEVPGTFSWVDGTPYAYNNLPPLFSTCSDPKMGYAFSYEGNWIQKDESGEAVFLTCSKPGNAEVATSKATVPMTTVTTTTVSTTTATTTTDTTTVPTTTTATTTTARATTTTAQQPTTTTATAPTPPSGFPTWAIILICVGSVLIIAICAFLAYMARRRITRLEAEIVNIERHDSRANSNKIEHSLHPGNPIHRYYNLPSRTDEWEIERKFVGIDYTNKLGEGAFGSVFLGRVLAKNIPLAAGKSIVEMTALRNDNDSVAVKMLHENADTMAETDFKAEIDLMKKIGYHERLVNLLACVTQSEPVLLITEYCSNGDLLEFMRERRKYMIEHTSNYDEDKIITAKQQVMFAIQIAYGLEYLATRGFLHRDIAARNIMVDHQETCKIGDFGLCRAIGRDNENYQAQGGKLPLKWMSPEAIDKYFFSTASDVWSYGILLFEIVTLGGTPYAGWPASDLLNKLKRGERMDKPDNCSEKLFEVMLQCWAELPSARPTFSKLRKRLGKLLEEVNQDDYYLKLNAQANYYVFESDEV